ncbi:conserved hypothetical protein [Candidatus Desulfosporosinus infrequens]|uniref:Uncharacterized protein n=1 Tax=Candidatus Desulfosporosinus infrequens TaxID=2043169 RepID=A0A2U3KMI1_9FIRM|nr:conserved hypothetical protein [Candidatus Desulfosporosinus infrequens]
MVKCKLIVPIESERKENCANCKRWIGMRCGARHLLTTPYEESKEFQEFDRLMRENKGIEGPL